MQEADEVAMEEEDGVHVIDEKYEADEVLRMGMVAAMNEERPELDQAIQDDKKGKVIVEEDIEVPLVEKSTESEPLVYTSNQEVKDTPIEDTSTEDEQEEDVGKMVEKFFVEWNETLAVLLVHILVGKW